MDLRTFMFLNKLQTRQTAKELGVTECWLSSIIHGHKQPSIELAAKIEQFTGGKVSRKDLRRTVK